jgi:hypothetical protein
MLIDDVREVAAAANGKAAPGRADQVPGERGMDEIRTDRFILLDQRKGIDSKEEEQHRQALAKDEGKAQAADQRRTRPPHAALSI